MNGMDTDKILREPKRQKRFRVIAAILFIAGSGVVAWLVLRTPQEPIYKGKPLSRWLAEYENTGGNWPRDPLPADEAMRHFGTNAFPMIRQLLHARDSALKLKSAKLLYHLHLYLPFRSEQQLHMRAFGALDALGRDAKPLVPTVAESLNHTGDFEQAVAES